MALLDQLTADETLMVQTHLAVALTEVTGEVDLLTKCPPATRRLLYGRGVLCRYRALRDELASLLDTDVREQLARLTGKGTTDGTTQD